MQETFSLDEIYLSDRKSIYVVQLTGKKSRLDFRPGDKLIINRALPHRPHQLALVVIRGKFSVQIVTEEFFKNQNPDSGDFIWGMVQTMIRELE
jgi:hypothetical protein